MTVTPTSQDRGSGPNLRVLHRSLRESVQEQLFEDIVEGRFKPGQKLIEAELAEAYGVSRGPIREAVRTLEAQGLLQTVSGKGTSVVRLGPDDVRAVYEMRVELDGLAARLGTRHIEDARVDEMAELLNEMESSIEDPGRWLRLNDKFHMTVYRASNRGRLCTLIAELMNQTAPLSRLYVNFPGMLVATHPDHRRLLDAVRKRDEARAETITEAHLARAVELMVKLVQETD